MITINKVLGKESLMEDNIVDEATPEQIQRVFAFDKGFKLGTIFGLSIGFLVCISIIHMFH
jgi:hypothetical protein